MPLSRKLGALTLLDPSGPTWAVGDDFTLLLLLLLLLLFAQLVYKSCLSVHKFYFPKNWTNCDAVFQCVAKLNVARANIIALTIFVCSLTRTLTEGHLERHF